jgi:hypothetical protein
MNGSTPTNAGALLSDSAETSFNVPGCIALTDKTSGTACAQTLTPLLECDDVACTSCFTAASPDETSISECETSAESGACSSYASSFSSVCTTDFADGGAATTCQDATTIVNLFCGTGG